MYMVPDRAGVQVLPGGSRTEVERTRNVRRSAPAVLGFVVAAVAAPSCSSQTPAPGYEAVPAAVLESALREEIGPGDWEVGYFAAEVDLDGKGAPETIVHVAGPYLCGTGGCSTFVFRREGDGLRLVTRISVSRVPVAIGETATNGWRDLFVHVSGGGIPTAHDARLRFDGRSYPDNPTIAPAEPVGEAVPRRIVIGDFASWTDGRRLRGDG